MDRSLIKSQMDGQQTDIEHSLAFVLWLIEESLLKVQMVAALAGMGPLIFTNDGDTELEIIESAH